MVGSLVVEASDRPPVAGAGAGASAPAPAPVVGLGTCAVGVGGSLDFDGVDFKLEEGGARDVWGLFSQIWSVMDTLG